MSPEPPTYSDPEGEAPWAMQLVVRLEKGASPTHTAVCEAAAMATVSLLACGTWAAEVERWQQGRIRKLVRRARGAAWEKAQAVPGVTVAHRGAEVRALVPGPTDAVHPDIARLQVQGLDLADERSPEPEPEPFEGVIVSITPEPKLTTGKAAAAAGHAAQLAWMKRGAPFAVRVEHPEPARFLALTRTDPVVVVDAGFTEIAPGTATATARWS